MSLREALAETRATLANFGDDAAREAQHLLAACLNMPLIAQHTEPERLLDAQQLEKLRAWTERRASGEPLAYLTGRREFWSLEFAVTPDVLVPRQKRNSWSNESCVMAMNSRSDSRIGLRRPSK